MKDKVGLCKKSVIKKGKVLAVDLRKVFTVRGMSFVFDEFVFIVLNNLVFFVFKLLSSVSCENFFFSNNSDEIVVFVVIDVGRYMYIIVDFFIFVVSFLFVF